MNSVEVTLLKDIISIRDTAKNGMLHKELIQEIVDL